MEPVAFWKLIGGKQAPAEAEIRAFLALDNATLVAALLKTILLPQDVAQSKQIMQGLAWGLPKEFERVREAIAKPQKADEQVSEGFEDLSLDQEEASFAEIAAQELTIFKGMIAQRVKMLSSGAIDEVRSVLVAG